MSRKAWIPRVIGQERDYGALPCAPPLRGQHRDCDAVQNRSRRFCRTRLFEISRVLTKAYLFRIKQKAPEWEPFVLYGGERGIIRRDAPHLFEAAVANAPAFNDVSHHCRTQLNLYYLGFESVHLLDKLKRPQSGPF